MIIPARFMRAREFSGGLAAVYFPASYCSGAHVYHGAWGYIDRNGNTAIEPQFRLAGTFKHGLAAATTGYHLGSDSGLIDTSGKMVERVHAPAFMFRETYSDSVVLIHPGANGAESRLYQHYDLKQRKFFGPIVDSPSHRYSGDLIAIKVGGKWGYMNEKGDIIIEPQFFSAGSFDDNGIAFVEPEMWSYGYIDREGRYIWYFTSRKPWYRIFGVRTY
jgi:hypothetical protein